MSLQVAQVHGRPRLPGCCLLRLLQLTSILQSIGGIPTVSIVVPFLVNQIYQKATTMETIGPIGRTRLGLEGLRFRSRSHLALLSRDSIP